LIWNNFSGKQRAETVGDRPHKRQVANGRNLPYLVRRLIMPFDVHFCACAAMSIIVHKSFSQERKPLYLSHFALLLDIDSFHIRVLASLLLSGRATELLAAESAGGSNNGVFA
jgi:hypothetical protein